MLLEEVRRILNQLDGNQLIHVSSNGLDIMVRFLDDASKLFLTTTVYNGGNYIPSSVRRCLSHKSPGYQSSIKTYLSVDEQNFQITLCYLGRAQPLTHLQFKDLLEEFVTIAEKWKEYLDENDKHDLIHVRVK